MRSAPTQFLRSTGLVIGRLEGRQDFFDTRQIVVANVS